MIELRYGNTNTLFVPGNSGGLLVDTDYAGTLSAFYRTLKQNGLGVKDIRYVLATHYHPDHMGLIGNLMEQGTRLLLVDVQTTSVHFSDGIFGKDRLPFVPIDEKKATVISCRESRAFLGSLGIAGEVIHTPSHSFDSISLVMDSGDVFVGDLEPYEHLVGYDNNPMLRNDWDLVLSYNPRRILYSHYPESAIILK